MEFKDHVGPVYALHRVFRLTDSGWPRAEVCENEAGVSSPFEDPGLNGSDGEQRGC